MEIFRLVYTSTFNLGRVESAPVALRDILSASRRNNAEHGVTGYLIFDGETFLQVLEGSPEAVTTTFNRIKADPRHRRLTTLSSRTASHRLFPNWAMDGYLRRMDQNDVFRRHGVEGRIDRDALQGDQIIALAIELSQLRLQSAGGPSRERG